MNDIQRIFHEIIEQALELRIPISDKLCYKIKINARAKARYGMCSLKNGEYIIEVSDALMEAPENFCKSTIAHEVLHTCRGCMNHQDKWKRYAQIMNRAFGYQIKTRALPLDQSGRKSAADEKYAVRCLACGKEYARQRKSKLIEHPDKYRCVCGGKFGAAYEKTAENDKSEVTE